MGVFRKSMSVSTLGLIRWESNAEKRANAQRRASRAEARRNREEAKLLKAERKALSQ